jgi:putative FmdB family regulatory protein
MPKYQMRCLNCGHNYETEKSYTDTSIDKCPECKSKQVQRIISAAPLVRFIGNGFTKTNEIINEDN